MKKLIVFMVAMFAFSFARLAGQELASQYGTGDINTAYIYGVTVENDARTWTPNCTDFHFTCSADAEIDLNWGDTSSVDQSYDIEIREFLTTLTEYNFCPDTQDTGMIDVIDIPGDVDPDIDGDIDVYNNSGNVGNYVYTYTLDATITGPFDWGDVSVFYCQSGGVIYF